MCLPGYGDMCPWSRGTLPRSDRGCQLRPAPSQGEMPQRALKRRAPNQSQLSQVSLLIMNIGRPTAAILLILVLLILAHSAYSLFQGNFRQASVMLPLLILFYVFGIARRDTRMPDEEEDPDEEPESDEDEWRARDEDDERS